MTVTEAVRARTSVRAYLDRPVPGATVAELLATASRSPSGGNLQPWHVHALTGAPLAELLAEVERVGPDPTPAYAIYPEKLADPYRTRRFEVGEQLYSLIPVAREDKAGRLRQLGRNAVFFGAPVGLFVFVDRRMGPPQWADLGMFVQTLLLLATERGLATCAQEYWALYSATVQRVLGAPGDQMLFCGIALGYRDPDAPINRLESRRAPASEWCDLRGFDA